MEKKLTTIVIPVISSLILSSISSFVSAELVLEPIIAGFGPPSSVPVAIQNARWHMNDADINTLTFRSMDTLFTTRKVTQSGEMFEFSKNERPLEVSYEFNNEVYTIDEFVDRTYTNALLVIKDDKVVYEDYFNNSDDDTHFMAWSMTKSITSILVGIAFEKGLINSLDDNIASYLPELQGGAYNGVTIREVLQMRSGVDYEENYDFTVPGLAATNHIQALVKNTTRFTDPAVRIKSAFQPGETFQYKTIDTAVLGWLVERVNNDTNISFFMTQYLWEPMGAEADGFFIMDGEPGVGREFTGAGYNAVLRDFARIGYMMLNGGRINNKQIVSSEWVKESTTPIVEGQDMLGMGYGYQWWTQAGSEAYMALGLQGQFIYVDPITDTVIVKMSYFPPDEQAATGESFAFFDAVSKWQLD